MVSKSESHDRAEPRKYGLIVMAVAVTVGVPVLVWAANQPRAVAKMNDFYREAWPAYAALAHGHVLKFLRLAPAYVGSLVIRAPLALIPSVWHGSARGVYIASALPCVFAMAAFCAWLATCRAREDEWTWARRLTPVAFVVLNPFTMVALLGGHPEEILGAVLCVGAVAMAARARGGWAGVLLGLAVVNKAWAVVAIPVVVVALPGGRRRAVIATAVTVATAMIPISAVRGAGVGGGAMGLQIGTIFNPPQLLWWFGPDSWIAAHARFAIVAAAAAAATLWHWRGRRVGAVMPDVLLLLTLVMLLRAALDPWNNLYYHVPFLFALIAYEVRAGKTPLLTLGFTLVLLIVTPIGGLPHMSYDVRAAAYAAVVVPTCGWLTWRLYVTSGVRQRPGGKRSPTWLFRARGELNDGI